MLLAFLGLCLFAATDIAERRIPKRLNLLVFTLFIFDPSATPIAIAIGSFYLVVFRASRGGVGYGDLRLAPCTALITSDPGELFVLHSGAWVMAGAFLLIAKGRSRNDLPFAPFIGLSAGLLQVS